MKRAITETVAELIIIKEEGLKQYLLHHEETLQAIECTDKEIGALIHEFELPLLLEIIEGPKEYFDQIFPDFAYLTCEARKDFAARLQTHTRECEHCELKVYYDSEWACKVDTMVSQNLEQIVHISQDSVASNEDAFSEEAAGAAH